MRRRLDKPETQRSWIDHLLAIALAFVFLVAALVVSLAIARIGSADQVPMTAAKLIDVTRRCERLEMDLQVQTSIDNRPVAAWCSSR